MAREGNFTKAAAHLGVSQSALSHTILGLEGKLEMRLLTRTMRSVSPTDAGERLLLTIVPRFEEIEAELASLAEMRDKPAGTVRITTSDHTADTVLLPKLTPVLLEYPDIKLEINTSYELVDIVEKRYDAGVRPGEQVAKDMIATRVGPDMRMAVVGSPSYFSRRAPPVMPQELTDHTCINVRLPTHGSLYVWEFKEGDRELKVRVEGQPVVNGFEQMRKAAVSGLGLAYTLEDSVQEHIDEGRLVPVLEDWCPPFTGYHLYYPSRRQPSPAFSLALEALRLG